jgi:hypothetical protein
MPLFFWWIHMNSMAHDEYMSCFQIAFQFPMLHIAGIGNRHIFEQKEIIVSHVFYLVRFLLKVKYYNPSL